jgi:hypothetical protein
MHPDLELMLSDHDVDCKCDLLRLSPEKRWIGCENRAAWIFRLQLVCGHRPDRKVILVCQECYDDILREAPAGQRLVILCPVPDCSMAAEILSVESL